MPTTCDHANVPAPFDAEPSSVTFVPRCTPVWSVPALATACAAGTTVIVTVAVLGPPGPVTGQREGVITRCLRRGERRRRRVRLSSGMPVGLVHEERLRQRGRGAVQRHRLPGTDRLVRPFLTHHRDRGLPRYR